MKGSGSQACASSASRMRAAHCSSSTEIEERMGKSHQAGWVISAGKTVVRVFPAAST